MARAKGAAQAALQQLTTPCVVVLAVVVFVAALTLVIEPSFWGAVLVAGVVAVIALAAWGISKCSRRPSWGWILGVLFIVGVTVGAVAVEADNEKERGLTACPTDYKLPQEKVTGPPVERAPVPIGADGAVEHDPQFTFDIGGGDATVTRRQAFRTPRPPNRNGFVLLGNITDGETGEDMRFGTIEGKTTRPPLVKNAVRLYLCVDPQPEGNDRLKPGTYTGSVLFGARTDRAPHLAPVPVTVTVRDSRNWLALIAVLVGVSVGIVIRAAADISAAPGKQPDDDENGAQQDPPAGDPNRHDPGAGEKEVTNVPPNPYDYVFSLRFLAMLVGGLAGGLFVYGPLFADDPSASVDLFDSLIPLTVAAFTATLAAKSIADLPPPSLDERKKGLAGKPLTKRERDALQKLQPDD